MVNRNQSYLIVCCRSRALGVVIHGCVIVALLFATMQLFPVHALAQTTPPPTHIVQAGESLSQIAEDYGISLDDLMRANGIDNPDAIIIGQVLLLPDVAKQNDQTPAVQVDPHNAAAGQPTAHIVQAGETLSQIAETYGLSTDELMRLNGIDNADTIYIGQKLRLTPTVNTGVAQTPVQTTPVTTTTELTVSPIATLNRVYTVQAGDDISRIALQMGVDENALRAINKVDADNTATLAPGQKLIIPATGRELKMDGTTPPSAGDQYTVQPGDSLGVIAQDSGLSLAALLAANHITDPDTVYVGQRLVIPPRPSAAGDPPKPVQIGRPRSGFYYYTVKAGDNLSTLARDFDSNVLAILDYNHLPDAETLYEGLALRIPYGPPQLPVRLPPAPLSGTRFMVSVSRQQCWVFQGDRVLHEWICSTGYGQWVTRTGTFAVQSKLEVAKSTFYRLDMPYWLGIYNVGSYENGIHGLPVKWDTGQKIWEGLIGQPATFGCAMLHDEDAAALFQLAYIGMPVYIVP